MAVSNAVGGSGGRGSTGRPWRNWAGNVTARPARSVTPASTEELAAAVRAAAADGLTVKAAGTGHSFTPAAATDGLLIRPERLTGIRGIDRAAGTVTVAAGTPLRHLNETLAAHGLSLTNMGDIMEQSVSGATATGTHGTGRDSASLAAQVTALELVTADGSRLTCSAQERPDVFAAARLGLGALGVISELTFAVEPEFLLTAREEPMPYDEVTDRFDELVAENEHFEFYWFPHTGSCNTKRNNRSQGPAAPPGRSAAGSRTSCCPTGSSSSPAPRGGRCRPPSRASPSSPAARCRPVPTPTSPTACSPPRGGCGSWRWSTRCPARPPSRRSAS